MEIKPSIIFTKRDPEAICPKRGTPYAAGLDLSSIEERTIAPRSQEMISTGLSVMIPHGYYGRVAPRSGLSVKHGIETMAGVVDSDYRGTLFVILRNHSDDPFVVHKGDRIAQLICEQCLVVEPTLISSDEFDKVPTERGEKGFGSTGV
ncbi:putative Deoxyuridine 5'-triphosphate nucleotidohydrolase [Blattamonas nauphoetae]|uniref:Deoxyuridine 5'-triphosphate nucleotidohydrolase n=1 Tax=Blattamonas nauphoetae TaxID=2049346 RepID=A0ABQ9YF47_9EUKA|nr:putative Deoxyuridine 5'-triphosphate nucleotidohydrolase [Blattamonas nauphoetae]